MARLRIGPANYAKAPEAKSTLRLEERLYGYWGKISYDLVATLLRVDDVLVAFTF
jgi:hypothetical protein